MTFVLSTDSGSPLVQVFHRYLVDIPCLWSIICGIQATFDTSRGYSRFLLTQGSKSRVDVLELFAMIQNCHSSAILGNGPIMSTMILDSVTLNARRSASENATYSIGVH